MSSASLSPRGSGSSPGSDSSTDAPTSELARTSSGTSLPSSLFRRNVSLTGFSLTKAFSFSGMHSNNEWEFDGPEKKKDKYEKAKEKKEKEKEKEREKDTEKEKEERRERREKRRKEREVQKSSSTREFNPNGEDKTTRSATIDSVPRKPSHQKKGSFTQALWDKAKEGSRLISPRNLLSLNSTDDSEPAESQHRPVPKLVLSTSLRSVPVQHQSARDSGSGTSSSNSSFIGGRSISESQSARPSLLSEPSRSEPQVIRVVPSKEKVKAKDFIEADPGVADSLEAKRIKVLNELIGTERDYVRDLVTIREMFLLPMKRENILPDAVISQIFSNITTLLNVNKVLLKEFTDAAEKDQGATISNCFNHLADYLKMYSMYCNNQTSAIVVLKQHMKENERLRNFLAQQSNSDQCEKKDLPSYLIKPVQRLCKYPLLLKELIKCTPVDHPDYKRLEEAYNKIEVVVQSVEESRKRFEAARQIQEIRQKIHGAEKLELVIPTRVFIKEGALKMVYYTELRDLHVYLFNDLLVICDVKHDKKDEGPMLHLKHAVPLLDLALIPERYLKEAKPEFELKYMLNGKSKSLVIHAFSNEVRDEWIKDINRAITEFRSKGMPGRPVLEASKSAADH